MRENLNAGTQMDNSAYKNHKHDNSSILNIFGENTELHFAIISGIFWVAGIITFIFFEAEVFLNTFLFIISVAFGSLFTFKAAFMDLRMGKFNIDFLMLFAAVGAALLGRWGESALLMFLFSIGHALEHHAMKRARKSITALSGLSPHFALLKKNKDLIEVDIDQLNIGDIIVVKPNSKIAADGVVINGTSTVNQAHITGESLPTTKRPSPTWRKEIKIDNILAEHRVFAGTINGSSVLEIKILRKAKDSTLARLIKLIKESEAQKSPTQHLADKFETYYVPIVLVVVIILMFAFLILDESFQESFYRSMSVLISASPCALAISTPSAVLSGIARAARQGVLIKGGRPLEQLGKIKVFAFDKTGTLTEGHPKLTHAIPFGKTSKDELLQIAVAVESLSDHPIAAAIVDGGKKLLGKDSKISPTNLQALTARGIRANVNDSIIHIGNRRLMEELTNNAIPEDIDIKMLELESKGHTAMIIHQDQEYLGLISVMDIARIEAATTIRLLKGMGIEKIAMLTGDNQKVANSIAKDIGITKPIGSMLPEGKVNAIIKMEDEFGSVAMVGDGVNDAPAMAKSSVGIAMGAAGSATALETADIALLADKLDNLPFALGLSRKANRIIKQNLVISLGMVAILVPMALLGTISIGPAVVGHEGSTLLVVLNALRLLGYEHN